MRSFYSIIVFSIVCLAPCWAQNTPRPLTTTAPLVSDTIQGDFDGDGKIELAIAVLVKEGEGNPIEDGIPDEWEVQFPHTNLPSIPVGCCDTWLVTEGDLNGDGRDDLSVYQAPMNGCTYHMTTYSFQKKKWREAFPFFLIPTGCDQLTVKEVLDRVFVEKGVIYYYDTEPNEWRLVKKKAGKK